MLRLEMGTSGFFMTITFQLEHHYMPGSVGHGYLCSQCTHISRKHICHRQIPSCNCYKSVKDRHVVLRGLWAADLTYGNSQNNYREVHWAETEGWGGLQTEQGGPRDWSGELSGEPTWGWKNKWQWWGWRQWSVDRQLRGESQNRLGVSEVLWNWQLKEEGLANEETWVMSRSWAEGLKHWPHYRTLQVPTQPGSRLWSSLWTDLINSPDGWLWTPMTGIS